MKAATKKAARKKAAHPKRKKEIALKCLRVFKFPAEAEIEFLRLGQPVVSFDLSELPSWNDLLYEIAHNRFVGGAHVKKLKTFGYNVAMEFASIAGLETCEAIEYPKKTKRNPNPAPIHFQKIERPFIERACVRVNVIRQDQNAYDVLNVCAKAFLDGFTRAGFWIDDKYKYVPRCVYDFGGIEASQRFELVIYDLPDEDRPRLF